MKDKRMEYVVIYEKGDSSYGAYVPDLPGCIAVGETLEEVQTLIDEAIEFHIEGLQEDGDDVPQPSSNILVQYDIPYLGIHKVVEYYVHNDDPALFSCRDCAGHLYLVTVGKNDEHKTWLRVGISNERFDLIRSGGIDLRNAFTDAENGSLFQVNIPNDDPTEPSLEVVQPNQIVEDMLPLPGERLGLKTDTLPALSNPEEIASYTKREILNLTLNFPGVFRTEAPITSLSKILGRFQELINTIGKSKIQISLLEIGSGSFDIRLAFTELVDLFDNSDLGNAIDEFLKLLNAGSDQDQLKPLVGQSESKVAANYTKFLESLSKSVEDARFTWTSPNPDLGGTAQLSKSQMQEVIHILQKFQEEISSIIKIRGTFRAISFKYKTFEIETEDKIPYPGKITEEAIETVKNVTLSKTYTVKLQKIIKRSETTDETKTEYQLLSLSAKPNK